MASLRVALTNNSLDWVSEFGDKGLHKLLSVVRDCLTWCVQGVTSENGIFNFEFSARSSSCEKLHLECLKCLKAIMNNKVGLKNLFDHSEALILLARCELVTILTGG